MAVYKTYKILLPIEEDSELVRRIQAYAAILGASEEAAATTVCTIGLYKHMERNLDLLERYVVGSNESPEPSGL